MFAKTKRLDCLIPVLGAALLAMACGQADQPMGVEEIDVAAVGDATGGGTPSRFVAEEVAVTARVVAIDRAARTVVLEGPMGRQLSLNVPEAAPNFDRVEVGQEVDAVYYESLAVSLRPADATLPGAASVSSVTLAPPGGKPGGVIADTTQISAEVTAIDAAKRRVTLKGPKGDALTVKVSDAVDLDRVSVGDKVVAEYTQALALEVQAN